MHEDWPSTAGQIKSRLRKIHRVLIEFPATLLETVSVDEYDSATRIGIPRVVAEEFTSGAAAVQANCPVLDAAALHVVDDGCDAVHAAIFESDGFGGIDA